MSLKLGGLNTYQNSLLSSVIVVAKCYCCLLDIKKKFKKEKKLAFQWTFSTVISRL